MRPRASTQEAKRPTSFAFKTLEPEENLCGEATGGMESFSECGALRSDIANEEDMKDNTREALPK